MAARGSRSEKVKKMFQQFDGVLNLNREEMTDLVVVVNPSVKFSDAQISAILNEKGLTYDGLLRTYDDGAGDGDVDRHFDALRLEGIEFG